MAVSEKKAYFKKKRHFHFVAFSPKKGSFKSQKNSAQIPPSGLLVFVFLNTVNWSRWEINAYGDLLQIKKSFLKHISSLQNETTRVYKINKATRFWSVFQVCRMKKLFLKRFQVYTMKTRFWNVSVFTKWRKTRFWSVSSLQNKKHIFQV